MMQSPLKTLDNLDETNTYQMADYKENSKRANGLDILGSQNGITIQEIFGQFQFGVLPPRQFKVYAADYLGVQFEQLFSCQMEPLDCCNQCLFKENTRPFELLLENNAITILKLKRENQNFCCSFDRPRVEVHYVETVQKMLGYIKHSSSCCQFGYNIYDSKDNLRYIIEAIACQNCCNCPFNEDQGKFKYEIKIPKGDVVAQLQKQFYSSQYGNNISAMFPFSASKEDKALILAATIMIEFSYHKQNRRRVTQQNI